MMVVFLRSLLLCAAVVAPSLAVPTFDSREPQLTTADHHDPFTRTVPAPSSLRRIRDYLVETIWPSSAERGNKYLRPGETVLKNLRTKYENDVVLRFAINGDAEARTFAEAADMMYLDVWSSAKNWSDVRIKKTMLEPFLGLLPPSMQSSHKLLMPDLAMAVYDTYPASPDSTTYLWRSKTIAKQGIHDLFFDDYRPLSVLHPWLRLLASLYPHLTSLSSIGVSAEGRQIPALRVGSRAKVDPDEPLHTVLITAGSHAREWISVSTATFVAYDLLSRYGTPANTAVTKFLDHYDIVFVPVLNPDGYEYTWTTDRLWRKTRQSTGIPFCAGIDLDRAFSSHWDGQDDVDNPCTESYAGTQPLEAIEAKVLSDWAQNMTEKENVVFSSYIDLHSYSQKVLYPYSYTCREQPTNLEDLEEVANVLAKSFRLTTGHFYEVDSACEGSVTLDEVTDGRTRSRTRQSASGNSGGSALDYFYAMNVKYAYQVKLRDTGTYGFLLPKGNIIPAGRETAEAILGLGRWLLGNRGIESKYVVDDPPETNDPQEVTEDDKEKPIQSSDSATQREEDSEWERVYDPDFELRRRR